MLLQYECIHILIMLLALPICPQTADFLKFYVLPRRLFTPSMSDGNVNTLLGPLNRLSFTVFPNKVGSVPCVVSSATE